MMKRRLPMWWLGWALIAVVPVARAAAIEVAPTTHELAPGQSTLSMTVTNRGDTPIALQVRGFVWTQSDGQDQLLPADTMLIAPAIFDLAPGQGQVLRAMLRAPAQLREGSYRLLLDELPAPGLAAGPVRMALRVSVPVFVGGSERATAQLAWTIDAVSRSVVVSNLGSRRERVHELSLVTASGQRLPAVPRGGPYVLAGSRHRWTLGEAAAALHAGEPVTLMALTDAGRVEVPLVVAP